MKKRYKEINVFNLATAVNKDSRAEKIKTTNINILLNKVRLNKKKDIKKKIVFISFLALTITFTSIFALI